MDVTSTQQREKLVHGQACPIPGRLSVIAFLATYLSRLLLIFPGAQLKIDGFCLRNIQGNLTGVHYEKGLLFHVVGRLYIELDYQWACIVTSDICPQPCVMPAVKMAATVHPVESVTAAVTILDLHVLSVSHTRQYQLQR